LKKVAFKVSINSPWNAFASADLGEVDVQRILSDSVRTGRIELTVGTDALFDQKALQK
jgi:hypothetical protein